MSVASLSRNNSLSQILPPSAGSAKNFTLYQQKHLQVSFVGLQAKAAQTAPGPGVAQWGALVLLPAPCEVLQQWP
jgi:hypothetical protein